MIRDRFLALHTPGEPLLIPNPWDVGSAKLLASLGFQALATTSAGFAMTLGRFDGSVSRDEALEHAAALVESVDVPVSADLENGSAEAGLAGCSIEDFSGQDIYPFELAVERVAAAAEAADGKVVLTARAENHLRGRPDLDDTIARLQAFQQAGADVLYAPALSDIDQIRTLVSSVDRPVNVLAMPDGPTVAELAGAGVARVSVGHLFAFAALGAVVEASRELLDQGTYSFTADAGVASAAVRKAFS
jgi:2-methylisocitrate lyase-like PEP mutase family enzyme